MVVLIQLVVRTLNVTGAVNSLIINGSDIYVGGYFTSIGGLARNNIAKLNNTNGGADTDWNPNANSIVEVLTTNGIDLYVGGGFTSIGGQLRNRIAKLNITDGSADANWNPDADFIIRAIAINGNDIYVGGEFSTMAGNRQPNFALFTDTVLPVEMVVFTANLVNNEVHLIWQTETEVNNYGFQGKKGREKNRKLLGNPPDLLKDMELVFPPNHTLISTIIYRTINIIID